jgi:acyl dehydratase
MRTIQKLTGNFLEDFRPGNVFRHKGGKTVTEGLFTTFTEFAMTSNPLSKNARYARAYGASAPPSTWATPWRWRRRC